MVQVKLAKEILTIRGQYGGVYFKTGRPGQHIQAMPRHVKRTFSINQMGLRDDMTGAAGIWWFALLAAFWTVWQAWALANMFTDRNGEKKKISGYNWYIHYALTFPETEALPFWKPPHAVGERPDYYVVVKGLWMYQREEVEWPGHICGGYYWEDGTWNGEPYYKTDESGWYIWWKDPKWVISKVLAMEDPPTTYYSDAGIVNDFYTNPVANVIARVYIGKRR